MSGGRGGREWERAIREHRTALSDFIETSAGVSPEGWRRSLPDGGWTPAQIAEHLALVYEGLLRELREGTPIRVRVGPAMQRVLHWVLLPHILFHRSFPLRARAPRELRPSADGLDREDAAERLRELAQALERALEASRGAPLTHPYFGPLTAPRALRFCAVHMEHHRRQLAALPR